MTLDTETQFAALVLISGIIAQWAIMQYRQSIQKEINAKLENTLEKLRDSIDSHDKEDEMKHNDLSRRISDQEISRAEVKAILQSVLQRLSSIEAKFDKWFELIETGKRM